MTIPSLLTPSFWFNPLPPPFVPLIDRFLLVTLGAFLLVGACAYVIRVRGNMDTLTRQALHRASKLLLTAGFVGLLLYALAYERVIYLSMRLWWIFLFAWIGWDAWRLYQFVFVKIPQIHMAQAEREKFEKWLPKKKGK